jgi:hypothetical protein
MFWFNPDNIGGRSGTVRRRGRHCYTILLSENDTKSSQPSFKNILELFDALF